MPARPTDLLAQVEAPYGATLTLEDGDEQVTATLKEWLTKPLTRGGRADGVSFRLDATMDVAVDPTRSMGSRDFHETFVDEDPVDGPAWYYVRAIQTDGEIVWSSPVWVDRPGGGEGD